MSEAHRIESRTPPPALAPWDLDQAVLDALPIGLCACDAQGRIVRVNTKAVELWGWAPDRLDPMRRFHGAFRIETLEGELIAPEHTPMARAVLSGERSVNAEFVVHNPDGKRWVAQVNVAPLFDDGGDVIGAINCFRDISQEHELRLVLARQQHTFDLAMVAAQMGTWRYTIADNICLFDENAQRLYGLTEARFLHDEAGVKTRFHPDDVELMWARVAKALDPAGDGRYEVEYRVRQLDGDWRWLSAWGLVEFDGDGPGRQPLAIAGASRDLTDMKRAEQRQRLLANELNHRVKNTLATVQSITSQTLRVETDLDRAREALEERIVSLARAHDLLTDRSWSGADLCDVVRRAMQPFSPAQIDMAGPSLDVSPQHALSLSLALHELATNAAKYGALSAPEGRVEIRWGRQGDQLNLTWRERGGPPASPPTRRGFGSRLLAASLRDLGGQSRLHFETEGVCAEFSAPL
ncbi:MAG TPA: HWE histidine kinase domain-containing protein [Caulobacteraceae bacterium]|nr:HWE histidine kinase domain-containing protein [Caulobacteraceae bacterium]